MAGEATTIARPYAEAVFSRAVDSGKLELWSEMLTLLEGIVTDSRMAGIVTDRRLDGDQLTQLLLDLGGDGLSIPIFGEGHHPPIRDGKHEDPIRAIPGKGHGPL